MDNLNRVLGDLKSENRRLEGELKRVRSAISVLRGLSLTNGRASGRPRRKLSAAARKRIADAQRARWAKWNSQKKAA
jgi:hypothetical protein